MIDDQYAMRLQEWKVLVRRVDLPPTVKAIICAFADFGDFDGTRVRPGLAKVAAATGREYNTVKAAIAVAREVQLVELVRKSRSPDSADEYRLIAGPQLRERVRVRSCDEFDDLVEEIRVKRRGKYRKPAGPHGTQPGAAEDLRPAEDAAETGLRRVDDTDLRHVRRAAETGPEPRPAARSTPRRNRPAARSSTDLRHAHNPPTTDHRKNQGDHQGAPPPPEPPRTQAPASRALGIENSAAASERPDHGPHQPGDHRPRAREAEPATEIDAIDGVDGGAAWARALGIVVDELLDLPSEQPPPDDPDPDAGDAKILKFRPRTAAS